ncbi:MAG: hypothetical protein K6D96_00170 [Acetatifactor sp.]|nr:hypothetical protein [Acetatifactor sp.]
MEKVKKSPSWVAIVLWFIFFWPVGVYLLIKKVTNDKSAAMHNSKVLLGIGIFFLFCAFVMITQLFDSSSDTSSTLSGVLFYGAGGGGLIYAAKRLKDTGERYKKFIDIVINQRQTTIDNIASQMGLGYDETVNGLQKMIDKGYFNGAYIDQGNHEIVLLNISNNQPMVNDHITNVNAQQRTVKCPNCGGNNIIYVGQVAECEFCGSPIE